MVKRAYQKKTGSDHSESIHGPQRRRVSSCCKSDTSEKAVSMVSTATIRNVEYMKVRALRLLQ